MAQKLIFYFTSGQPVLIHGAVTQECSSLLPGTQCDFCSVAMICDLNGVAGIDPLHLCV